MNASPDNGLCNSHFPPREQENALGLSNVKGYNKRSAKSISAVGIVVWELKHI